MLSKGKNIKIWLSDDLSLLSTMPPMTRKEYLTDLDSGL
jgi:hypothetical protein